MQVRGRIVSMGRVGMCMLCRDVYATLLNPGEWNNFFFRSFILKSCSFSFSMGMLLTSMGFYLRWKSELKKLTLVNKFCKESGLRN